MALKVLVVDDAYEGQTIPVSVPGVALPVRAVDAGVVSPVPTWAQVLVAGDASGTTNPLIASGQSLAFASGASVGANANHLRLQTSGVTRVDVNATDIEVRVALLTWPTSVAPPVISQNGPAGQPFTVQAADGAAGGAAGGNLLLYAGDGEDGGGVEVTAGAATGAGDGGGVTLTPGAAAVGVPGVVQLSDSAGVSRIRCGTSGVAFNAGAMAISPSVIGSKGGNAALAGLLETLADMGLITDNTT